ncbi:MAG: hypothetical protein AB8G22_25215 [Saprospiraceae bacterium]
MNFTKEQLDDLYNNLHRLEKDLDQFDRKVEQINNQFQKLEKITVSDILYRDKELERSADRFKSSVQEIVTIANYSPSDFSNILFNGDITYAAQCQILAKLSQPNETWKNIIEQWTTPIIEIMCGDNQHQGAELLLNLTHELPNRYFNEESLFIKNLLRVLETNNDRAIYWTTHVLWNGDYYYPTVIAAFHKLLYYPNWRMRAVIHDHLKTWEREREITFELYSLPFLDHFRRLIFRNYYSKLSNNMTY